MQISQSRAAWLTLWRLDKQDVKLDFVRFAVIQYATPLGVGPFRGRDEVDFNVFDVVAAPRGVRSCELHIVVKKAND